MSASKQKKLRKQQREEGVDKRLNAKLKEEKKKARSKRTYTIVGIIVVVLAIAILFTNSSLFYRTVTGATVGEESYSVAEYRYYYHTTYINYLTQYQDMLGMMGYDSSRSPATQSYDENMTWADLFKDVALSNMQEVTLLWKEAQKDGFVLNETQQAELEEILAQLDTVHEGTDYPSANSMLAAYYGKGVNKSIAADLTERSYIAEKYDEFKRASFTYTDEELAAKYDENKDKYDRYSFLSVYVSGEADEEAGIDQAAAMADAKGKIQALMDSGITGAEDFAAKASELTGVEADEKYLAGNALGEDYAEWIKDSSRQEGDVTSVETETGVYALYFISRDDNEYNTKNVRHILIKAVADENGEYTEEAKQEAKAKAEELLKTWQEGEATEDSFAQLAMSNSEDAGSVSVGGLYENVAKGRMVQEFNDWIFAEDRLAGDTGIVFNEDSNYCGYHVMYFVSDGENYREYLAETDLRTDDYSQWYTSVLENYETNKTFAERFV